MAIYTTTTGVDDYEHSGDLDNAKAQYKKLGFRIGKTKWPDSPDEDSPSFEITMEPTDTAIRIALEKVRYAKQMADRHGDYSETPDAHQLLGFLYEYDKKFNTQKSALAMKIMSDLGLD